MRCDFQTEQLGDSQWRHTCQREGCGFSIVVPRPKCIAVCNVVGLGDAVAWVLSRAGIRIRRKCGCKGRRQKLNEVGEAVAKGVRRAAKWFSPT